jgi:Flp pilus assembly protein TadG
VPSSASARPRRRRFRIGERGTTSLEFALVGGLFVSLLLGAIEIGRYMMTLESVRTATAEAVRQVTIRGSQNMIAGSAACTDLAGPLGSVAARVPVLQASLLTVTMSGCATQAGITTVQISVQYPFTFTISLFGATNRPITEAAQAVFN